MALRAPLAWASLRGVWGRGMDLALPESPPGMETNKKILLMLESALTSMIKRFHRETLLIRKQLKAVVKGVVFIRVSGAREGHERPKTQKKTQTWLKLLYGLLSIFQGLGVESQSLYEGFVKTY